MDQVRDDFRVRRQTGNSKPDIRNLSFQVYILQNPAGKRYIGITSDFNARIAQHNNRSSKWTKGKGPWTLQWKSTPLALSQARKLENKLKRQKGGVGLEILICTIPSALS